jgi:hypothetical protein
MNELKSTKKVVSKKKVAPEKKSKHISAKTDCSNGKKMDKTNC